MDMLLQDLRYAVRALRRSRGFTLIAVACLALGIGVNTAMFSIVNAILLRPLPFADAERIVALQAPNQALGIEEGRLTYGDLADWQAGSRSLEAVAGVLERNFTLMGEHESERVEGSLVTANLFPLLGLEPRLGRGFRPEDAQPMGFEPVVMLSDGLWRRRFAADESIVGRPVRINDRELVVIGIMPPGLGFPQNAELWLPLGQQGSDPHAARFVYGVGKLRPGVSVEAADREMKALAARLAAAHPETHRNWGARVLRFRDSQVDPNAQRLLYLMLGAVGFVLLIACANVANLLLARGSERAREVAVRAALGASRPVLVRQLLTESVLIALLGGALGLLIAIWWVATSVRAIPEEMAYWIRFEIDARVLLYTFGISIGTGLLFGILPALRGSRADLHSGLKEGSRGAGTGRHAGRLRSALVAAEVALSLVLLVGAALMVQSFLRLQRADAGFDPDRVLSLRVGLTGDRYDPIGARAAFYQMAAERLAALPGARGAAATLSIPADDGLARATAIAEGQAVMPDEELPIGVIGATNGLWNALGIPLLAGRDFYAREVMDSAATVAIVGRSLAARLWPDGGAVGRRLRASAVDSAWLTVIGVAPDLQYEEFGEESLPDRLQLYLPYARTAHRNMALVVRTDGRPGALARAAREEIRRIDPNVAPYDIMTMTERRRFTTWPQRVFGSTFGAFGAIALALALAGVYGVTAYGVAQRRREIGVRMALGARSRDVLHLVIGQGTRPTLVGVGIGLLAAFGLARLLGGILYGVSVSDPRTYLAAALLLAGAALAACLIPARRATRVEPVTALRD